MPKAPRTLILRLFGPKGLTLNNGFGAILSLYGVLKPEKKRQLEMPCFFRAPKKL